MAEHVLRGEIALYPRQEGGRQLIIIDNNEVYRFPLTEEAVEGLREECTMDDAELDREITRRAARAKIVIPNGKVQ